LLSCVSLLKSQFEIGMKKYLLLLCFGAGLHLVAQSQTSFGGKPRKQGSEVPFRVPYERIDGQRKLPDSKQKFSPKLLTTKVVRDSAGTPVYVEYRRDIAQKGNARTSMTAAALQYVEDLKPMFKLESPANELKVQTVEEDELKHTHVRLQQQFRGVDVYGGELIVHAQHNQFTSINGYHFKTPQLTDVTPQLDESQAAQLALNDLRTHTVVRELGKAELQLLKKQLAESELLIYYPEATPEVAHLAWRLVVRPNFVERWNYFIDAKSGQILHKYNHTCALDGPARATGRDLNNATQTVNTYQKGNTFYLVDATRAMFNARASNMPDQPVGAIWTVDARNSKADDITIWQFASNNNTWSANAISAHVNAGLAFEYYSTKHRRNSLNGKGGNMISVVNVRDEDGTEMDNAFWNGEVMAYGNGATAFTPLAGALDVAGHEMTHGVIENTARLEYNTQPGAINESLADVFGVLIERKNWTIGETVTKRAAFPSGALRDMANPNQGGTRDPGYQPKTMAQYDNTKEDNGGVHINSGIPNYAFYLFATNTAVGLDKAERVYYRAMTTYLTRFSKFIDLRVAIIKSTTDLFGATSNETKAAQSAFDQVGITDNTNNNPAPKTPSTLPANTGTDFILLYGADKKLYSTPTTAVNLTVKASRNIVNRPSVTDDGKFVYFVTDDKRIRAVSLVGTPDETVVSDETRWNKVAISRDGRKLAALTDQADKSIFVYSFDLRKWVTFKLYNPTYTNGVSTGDVQYADGLEWDPSGEYLVYDAFNKVKTSTGRTLDYWDVGFIKVWDSVANNFGDGSIEKLFSDLSEGENVGNPTFTKNSTAVLAFDYYYEPDEEYAILGLDMETDSYKVIAENNTFGTPDYSRLDDRVVYVNKNGTANRVSIMPLNVDKITGRGTATNFVNNATWPLWVSQGTRTLPSINFAAIANRFENAPPFTLSATASTGDKVLFKVISGPATVSGNLLTVTGSGTVTVRAYNESERPFFPIATADRTFQVIPILSVNPALAAEVQVFPNPAREQIEVSLPSQMAATELQLTDLAGRTLQTLWLQKQTSVQLDVRHLATGVYFLNIKTPQGIVQRKVLKQ
jgi:bacillolysin